MRKTLSFVLALALLLALAGSALPESAEAIPGTDFPSPDTLTGIRAVSVQVQEIPEETMRQLVGADFIVNYQYENTKTAKEACEKFAAAIREQYPDLTDGSGNVLLPVEYISGRDTFQVKVKRPAVTVAGEEVVGWFDFSACSGVLQRVMHSTVEHTLSAASSDGTAYVALQPFLHVAPGTEFAEACQALLARYTGDLAEYYQNVVAGEMDLSGAPAYRVTLTTHSPWDEKMTILGAVYLTTNAAGDYIQASVFAPAEETDASGAPVSALFTQLVQMFESTYTRTRPQ